MNKGNISITTAIIGSLGMIVASAFTSWTSSNAAIAEVKTEVVQVTERENNHYAETQKQLAEMNRKLDLIIGKGVLSKAL